MGCLPCCDKTLKVFGSLRAHACLGGREVKCPRTYSQKCEVCKFTFERVDWGCGFFLHLAVG